MSNESDENLVAKYIEGEDKSLELLVNKYTAQIYNFVAQSVGFGQDAEDVTQDTFIKVWKSIKKFDQSRKFKPWLFKIARNTTIDFLRKKRFTSSLDIIVDDLDDESKFESLIDFESTSLNNVAMNSDMKEIKAVLLDLPGIYRTVLNLYYFDQLTMAEIAEILELPIDTIKSRHRRALLKIREILSNKPNFAS